MKCEKITCPDLRTIKSNIADESACIGTVNGQFCNNIKCKGNKNIITLDGTNTSLSFLY